MNPLAGRGTLGLLVLMASMLVAAPGAGSHPPAPHSADGSPVRGNYHRWLHASKMPMIKGRVVLIRRACPGRPQFVGCVFTRRPRRIYLKPGARAPRTVLYHELGHVFDLRVLRHSDRRAFKRIMRTSHRGWWSGDDPPAEQFAEGYAACSRSGLSRRAANRSVYGFRPSIRQHRAICRLIVRGGRPTSGPKGPQPPAKPPPVISEPPRPAPPPADTPAAPPEEDRPNGPLNWLFPGRL